jgi:hypothetical protein
VAGSNDADEPSPMGYHPLPELDDPQGMAVASEVDTLLVAVMGRMPMSTDQWRYFWENLRQANDLASRLECKKHFLAILLREGQGPHLPEARSSRS